MIKYFLTILLGLLLWGCSSVYHPTELKQMNLHLGESNYAELVDFLYDYAGENRLNVLWFGWYRTDNPRYWYERSDEESNFKIKLALLAEENGSIFIVNRNDEERAYVSIDYGDKKPVWLEVVEDFKKVLAEQGWRLEELKQPKPK